MKPISIKHILQTTVGLLGLVVLATSPSSFAQADNPSLSGPSIVPLDSKATFNGTNFPPRATVRVQTHEDGAAPYHVFLVVDDKGSLSHEIEPSLDGPLSLSVFDTNENEIARANAFVTR